MVHWLDKIVALMRADTADLRELARIAGGNPKTFYRGIKLEDLDLDGQNVEGMEFGSPTTDGFLGLLIDISKDESLFVSIDDLINAIRKIGRQEERLVLLLKLILENRNLGAWIIETYGLDKAKYARRALADLRKTLEDENAQMSLFETIPIKRVSEDILVHIIQHPFSRGMPDSRAAILYFMTMHLSGYPKINDFLRSRLQSTHSIFLDSYRKEMEKSLDNPPTIYWLELIDPRTSRRLPNVDWNRLNR
jgi:hypothetical protein